MKEYFPDLSHRAFQHPLDAKALKALEKARYVDVVIKKFFEVTGEKYFRLLYISENIRLGPRQCPSIYNKFVEATKILDIPTLPEIYIDSRYEINAYAFGMQNHTIVLLSGLIDILTEDELLAIIGHELGHIKCNHMLYKTIAHYLTLFGVEMVSSFLPGIGPVAMTSIELALAQWYRMAEFSCDRTALLVVQDPKVVASALAKLSGYSRKVMSEINIDEIINQAHEYEFTDSKIEQMMKLQIIARRSHPMPIVRVREITDWAKSKQYSDILAGHYPKVTGGEPTCPECNTMIFGDTTFCPKCGTRITTQVDNTSQKRDEQSTEINEGRKRFCPQCSAITPYQAKFCLKCGVRLSVLPDDVD